MPSRAECGSWMTRPPKLYTKWHYSCKKPYPETLESPITKWNSGPEMAFPTFPMGDCGFGCIRNSLARGCPSAPQMTLDPLPRPATGFGGRETTTPRESSPQISNRSSFSLHLPSRLLLYCYKRASSLLLYPILRDIFHTPTALSTGGCTTN